jgi:ubiquinone/menaquinone biosynthesis C-methylase UbiE
MNKTEQYKLRSKIFFDRVANTNYGNSPYLDKSILSITKFEEGDVILDIGCGQGRFLDKVHSENKNISCFGLDLSTEMIRIASEKATGNCHFNVGECDSLPYERCSFSKIFCMNSFHHFSDPEKSLSEISRVIKDNGEIIIGDVWLPLFLREAVNAFLPFTKTGDYRIYSKREMVDLFSRYAFEMKNYFYVHPFLFAIKFKRNKSIKGSEQT